MAKKSKIEFERGRIYYIIDYILREYNKNFRKEFVLQFTADESE